MKFLLTPIGSAGDNFPFFGLGLELKRRGHEVVVVTGHYFEPMVRRLGLNYVEVVSEEEYRQAIGNPDLWHPIRGYRTVMEMVCRQLERIVGVVRELIEPGRTAIVAHSLDYASRSIQDKTGLPVVTIHLQPIIVRTMYQLPAGPGMADMSFLPHWLKRLVWRGVDRWFIDPPVLPTLDAIRAGLGLPPVRRILDHWIHSPLLTIGLFPEWFAPRQPDWPQQFSQTSFPLFDSAMNEGVDGDVEAFLSAGEAPIVFTPGSAMAHGHEFFAAAAEACRQLGWRGLLLTRHAEQIPGELPQGVRHFPFAPLTKILPRCAALVHHGGIGTMSAALAAGIPQLIMPMSHDQPDNAARVRRLGVGDALWPRQFRGNKVTQLLQRLLESSEVTQRCREAATRCAEVDGIGQACDLIEGAVGR